MKLEEYLNQMSKKGCPECSSTDIRFDNFNNSKVWNEHCCACGKDWTLPEYKMKLSEVIQKVIDFYIGHRIGSINITPITKQRMGIYVEYLEYNPQSNPCEEAEVFFKKIGVVGLCRTNPIANSMPGEILNIIRDVVIEFHYTVSDMEEVE